MFYPFLTFSQTSTIKGMVIDSATHAPIAFANVLVVEAAKGDVTAEDGSFQFESLKAGIYTLKISYIGYQAQQRQVVIENGSSCPMMSIALQAESTLLAEISVTPQDIPGTLTHFSPSLSAALVNDLPSSQDVMQAMQVLPSVASPQGFTNELNVRGGASVENRFIVDGIEVPILNHFNSAGTSGGIRSLLNPALVKKATLHASYLPVQIGNASSSVLEFSLSEGGQKIPQRSLMMGSGDAALLWEGRLSKHHRHSMVVAARQSYLSPTLKILKRPVLSQYGDAIVKTRWYVNDRNVLSFMSLASYDKNRVNYLAPDSPSNQFVKDVAPARAHRHVTTALKYQHFQGENVTTLILSAYGIEQKLHKRNNQSDIFYSQRRYDSFDSRALLRAEHIQHWQSASLILGGSLAQQQSRADFTVDWTREDFRSIDYQSNLQMIHWSSYAQLNQSFSPKWNTKLGLRYDGSSYSPQMKSQFSPRMTLSFHPKQQTRLYANAALYHQMPEPLSLALRDDQHHLINHATLKPFTTRHFTIGLQLTHPLPLFSLFTVEAFSKHYQNYPVSLRDGVVLASKGDGFNLLGNEPLISNGIGRAYGIELTAHLQASKGYYGLMSFSLSKSEFQETDTKHYLSSSVDTRHIVNLVIGKHFKKDWHVGMVCRLQSGRPTTPWDAETSATLNVWSESLGRGIPNYQQLNSQRLPSSSEIDFRLDKTFQLRKAKLKAIIEILNLSLTGKQAGQPVLILDRNDYGQATAAQPDGDRYRIKEIESELFLFVPTLGVKVEF